MATSEAQTDANTNESQGNKTTDTVKPKLTDLEESLISGTRSADLRKRYRDDIYLSLYAGGKARKAAVNDLKKLRSTSDTNLQDIKTEWDDLTLISQGIGDLTMPDLRRKKWIKDYKDTHIMTKDGKLIFDCLHTPSKKTRRELHPLINERFRTVPPTDTKRNATKAMWEKIQEKPEGEKPCMKEKRHRWYEYTGPHDEVLTKIKSKSRMASRMSNATRKILSNTLSRTADWLAPRSENSTSVDSKHTPTLNSRDTFSMDTFTNAPSTVKAVA